MNPKTKARRRFPARVIGAALTGLLLLILGAGCGSSTSKADRLPGADLHNPTADVTDSVGSPDSDPITIPDLFVADLGADLLPPNPQSTACQHQLLNLGFGKMDGRAGTRGNLLIVAPHGKFDDRTRHLADELSLQLSSNMVRAWGYRTSEHFINVNRPTEGTNEQWTDRAQKVYDTFRSCAEQYGREIYIEIHGNSRGETALEIQIATVNVDLALANQLVTRFEQIKSGLLAEFTLKVEPRDTIYWKASGNKKSGMLSRCVGRCLHIELPKALRIDENRNQTVLTLQQLLSVLL